MVSYAITGANRGIGLEFIRQLSQDETRIVFALVRDTASSPELTELARTKANVHIVHGDLNSRTTLQEAARTVASVTGGSLDVLINNGAYLDSSTMMTMPSQLSDPDIIDHVRDVTLQSVEANVFGAINLTNYFLPLIERGTEKKIVHTTTGLSEPDFTLATGIPGLVPYTGSKAMMNVIIAKYGVELRPKDIHIVAISPGWVETSPLPEEGLAWIGSCFRKVDPNVKARIQPEESVRHQLDTISKLGWDVQGRMISHHGDRNWF